MIIDENRYGKQKKFMFKFVSWSVWLMSLSCRQYWTHPNSCDWAVIVNAFFPLPAQLLTITDYFSRLVSKYEDIFHGLGVLLAELRAIILIQPLISTWDEKVHPFFNDSNEDFCNYFILYRILYKLLEVSPDNFQPSWRSRSSTLNFPLPIIVADIGMEVEPLYLLTSGKF